MFRASVVTALVVATAASFVVGTVSAEATKHDDAHHHHHHHHGGHGDDIHDKSFMEMKQEEFFEYSLHATNIIGSYILLFGVCTAMINFGLLVVQHFVPSIQCHLVFGITQPDACNKKSKLTIDHIKLELGRIVAFSLLLLVAADVLETLLKPMHHLTIEDLYKMALVGGIRTTLAYFLNKEIEEIIHHMSHHEHNGGEHHGGDHDSHDSSHHHDDSRHHKKIEHTTPPTSDDESSETGVVTTTPTLTPSSSTSSSNNNNKKKNKKQKKN